MKVITSDSLLCFSRFHRTFYMVLEMFDLDWKDVGVCKDWSDERIVNTLESLVSFNSSTNGVKANYIPCNIKNKLIDTSNHPQLGFPNVLIPQIIACFVVASKRGWSNAKLLTAASGVVLAKHFSQSKAIHVC